jgi:FtsZ-binding cell division protein ZapB
VGLKKFAVLEERIGDLIDRSAALKREREELAHKLKKREEESVQARRQLQSLSREREVISSKLDRLILKLEGKTGRAKD